MTAASFGCCAVNIHSVILINERKHGVALVSFDLLMVIAELPY